VLWNMTPVPNKWSLSEVRNQFFPKFIVKSFQKFMNSLQQICS